MFSLLKNTRVARRIALDPRRTRRADATTPVLSRVLSIAIKCHSCPASIQNACFRSWTAAGNRRAGPRRRAAGVQPEGHGGAALADALRGGGLEATIDGVGNVLGRSRQAGKALLIGSHSDTQPTGGWLDGALGVIYALEVVRALAADTATRALPVDAVSFQDEESRFVGCLGSRSLIGALPRRWSGSRGPRRREAGGCTREAGLADAPRLRLSRRALCRLRRSAHRAGPGPGGHRPAHRRGHRHRRAARHPLRVPRPAEPCRHDDDGARRDAATALYELAHRINQEFPKVAGPRSVWTMGRLRVEPNATSIVPGYADLDLQFRDASEAPLDAFEKVVARARRGDERARRRRDRGDAGARADPADADGPGIAGAHRARPSATRRKVAAHAERRVPRRRHHVRSMPSAMLFIPSIGGISHDFAENSRDEDIVLGCQVLADASASILAEANARRADARTSTI